MSPEDLPDDNDGRFIGFVHMCVVELIKEKHNSMSLDVPAQREIVAPLLDAIQEIGRVMSSPTVRGHLDPKLHTPEVDENSSWKNILDRLEHQVTIASDMKNPYVLGPAPTPDELHAMYQMEQILRCLYTNISRVGVLQVFE